MPDLSSNSNLLYDQSIDRLSCRQRPQGKNSGTQSWRDLLFLHWDIPIDLAQSLLPKGLTLDLYDGKAWIGVVPFTMEKVKPSFLPQWAAFNFLECNVRLYVLAQGQPGVYFLSLEAASWLAVQAARIGWKLPYFYAKMQTQQHPIPQTQHVEVDYKSYRSNGTGIEVKYIRKEALSPSKPGSLAFFFLERYLLFIEKGEEIYSGQVYHPPYPAYEAEVLELKQNLTESHGYHSSELPTYVHASTGVDVEVFALKKLSHS